MKELWLDFETFNENDIKKIGTYRYAETCEPLLLGVAVDDEPAFVLGGEVVYDFDYFDTIMQHFTKDTLVYAHYATFDRQVMWNTGFPRIPLEQWRDTAAIARYNNLPSSLDMFGESLHLGEDEAKLKDGKRLIRKFCRPRKPSKKDPSTRWGPHNAPEDWARFIDYCRQDVEAMRTCALRVKQPPAWFWEQYLLDQEINDRGVRVDFELVDKALAFIEPFTNDIDEQIQALTDDVVEGKSCVQAMKGWLSERYGVETESLDEASIKDLLEIRLPPDAHKLLKLRQAAGQASVNKFKRIKASASENGRVCGMTQFYGAQTTGRFSGRVVQLQNLPARTPYPADITIAALQHDLLDTVFGNDALAALTSTIRGTFIASEGKELHVADLTGIEGRLLPFAAQDTAKLEEISNGVDMYKKAAMPIYGKAYDEISDDERFRGKVAELSLGYQGAVVALQGMARNYGASISEEEARIIVKGWRKGNPMTVKFWRALENAAEKAILHPGEVFRAGPYVKFKWQTGVLYMQLVSGRVIMFQNCHYAGTQLAFTCVSDQGSGTYLKELYGGFLAAVATQGLARDVLLCGMLDARGSGYDILFSVHDEIVAEAEIGVLTHQQLCAIMSAHPAWLPEFVPLAAKGGTSQRYMK